MKILFEIYALDFFVKNLHSIIFEINVLVTYVWFQKYFLTVTIVKHSQNWLKQAEYAELSAGCRF